MCGTLIYGTGEICMRNESDFTRRGIGQKVNCQQMTHEWYRTGVRVSTSTLLLVLSQ